MRTVLNAMLSRFGVANNYIGFALALHSFLSVLSNMYCNPIMRCNPTNLDMLTISMQTSKILIQFIN